MKFLPAFNWVLLRMNEGQETMTRGGIIVVENTSNSQFLKGTVAAAGPGVWSDNKVERIPVSVKVGDKIYFTGGGLEIMVDGLKYTLIRENAIVGVLEDDADGVSNPV